MSRLAFMVFVVFLQFSMQPAVGQPASGTATAPGVEDAILRLKSHFDSQYVVAKTNPEGTDLVAAGTVLVLRKEGLIMTKVLLPGGRRSSPIDNVYENGQIAQSGLLGALSKLNSFLGGSRPDISSRAFEIGSKIWVTRVSVQTSGVEFSLMSDPSPEERFHAVLKFPISDTASADRVLGVIPQVLAFDQPPPTAAPMQAVAPPPVADGWQQLRQAAEAGDPEAMFQLGNALVQRGENVDAFRWFERASDRAHVKATNALGFMYDSGRGVPQNFARASATYLRAMKAGDVDAMINRGLMLQNGRGVNKDQQQAYMHFLLAVAYARDDGARNAAIKLKEDTASKLTKTQIARGQSMADNFVKEEMK